MGVAIALTKNGEDYSSLLDVLELKFGKEEESASSTLVRKSDLQWSGDITKIVLYVLWPPLGEDLNEGILEIRSIQIFNQIETDKERERQKVAEEGLDDF